MVEQICPECKAGNDLANVHCGQCGAALEQPLAARPGSQLTIGRGRLLADPALQQIGRTVAVSVAALLADAGLAWLRRRFGGEQALEPEMKKGTLVPSEPAGRRTTVLGQRVTSYWRHGRLLGQTVEQSVWHLEESSGEPGGF
jgi:hypothetical protein